jgi:hypothetical protein
MGVEFRCSNYHEFVIKVSFGGIDFGGIFERPGGLFLSTAEKRRGRVSAEFNRSGRYSDLTGEGVPTG